MSRMGSLGEESGCSWGVERWEYMVLVEILWVCF